MSLFSRRILFLLPLALMACGFTPVYAPGGTASALRGKLKQWTIISIIGYLLVQNLEERLGRSDAPVYSLSLTLLTGEQGQAITASNETTRYSVVGKVDYVLSDIASKETVASGSVENFTGYCAVSTPKDNFMMMCTRSERLMVILADLITTQLYTTVDFSLDQPG